MINKSILGFILIASAFCLAFSPAARDLDQGHDCDRAASEFDCYEARDGSLTVEVGRKERQNGSSGRLPGQTNVRDFTVVEMGAAFCADATADAAASGGASPEIAALCRGFAALSVAPSREQVLTAFRELALYRGAIRTDPVRSTFVNLETYYWCADDSGVGCDLVGERERTVTLLGQAVRIRPRILSYAWDFGDGAAAEVADGRAAHTYERAMTAEVTLTLTWTADYAVGSGRFQAIGDTTTTSSPARVLPVREAEAVIVGGG